MPSKRHTKKDKKQQKGKKKKNTTFKKGGYKEESKTLPEIINEKLTDDLVQQLIDNPDKKYYIMLLFCDNKIIVNTSVLLKPTYSAPEEGYNTYKNSLTIPDQFEKDKVLKIIVYANDDGIQYNTIVDDQGIMQSICKNKTLPVIYNIPEITAPSDIISSADLTSEINESMPEDEELKDIWSESIPYDEDLTSPNDIVEQAADMETLQAEELEDVTDDIVKTSVSEPTDDIKEIQEKIKKEELKDVSEKPELKDFKDDLSLLKKKTKDNSVLMSREEGDVDTSDMKTDFRELAREQKEAKRKQQEEIDRLAHEARMKAEEEMMFEKYDNDDDDELFKNVDDTKAQHEDMVSIIVNAVSELTNIYNGKSKFRDDSSYQPLLNLIDGKYQTMLEHIPRINIDEKDKETILVVLQNNHERLFMRGKHDNVFKAFEHNFKEKIKDSIEILTNLRNYFETLDKRYLKNFGKLGKKHQDYTQKLGGKKTRKNRRKTKQRKTKKRT